MLSFLNCCVQCLSWRCSRTRWSVWPGELVTPPRQINSGFVILNPSNNDRTIYHWTYLLCYIIMCAKHQENDTPVKARHINKVFLNTKCNRSSWRRVVGAARSSSSSSFSQPSTVIFLRVLMGLSPSSGRALMMYLEWMKPISPLLQNLYWRRKRASLPWSRYCGFGMPHLAENSFSSWGRSHRTSVKESGLEGPGPGVATTDGCVWIISLAALTTWNSFIAAKPELAAVKPLWSASNPSSLGPCWRATWAESQRSARSSTVT